MVNLKVACDYRRSVVCKVGRSRERIRHCEVEERNLFGWRQRKEDTWSALCKSILADFRHVQEQGFIAHKSPRGSNRTPLSVVCPFVAILPPPPLQARSLYIMSIVNITQIQVLNNPTHFSNPYQFEITFECIAPLDDCKLSVFFRVASPYPLFATTFCWCFVHALMKEFFFAIRPRMEDHLCGFGRQQCP